MTQVNKLFGATLKTAGVIAITGGAANTYAITTALIYSINGKSYGASTGSGVTTPTVDGNGAALASVPIGKGCVVLWAINAGGTVAVFQSELENVDSDGVFERIPNFPSIDLDTWCPIGYQALRNNSAGALVFGSTNWNVAGIDGEAIVNLSSIPVRPQGS